MVVTFRGMVISVRRVHANAPEPIEVRLSGNAMPFMEVSKNALSPMLVNPLPMVMPERSEQDSKAALPIEVTLFGMVMLFRRSHREKHSSPIVCSLFGGWIDSNHRQ